MHVNLCLLENTPIFEQLAIEEALLRADSGNWCLINSGSPPAIVLGISSKPEEHIDEKKIQKLPVPVVRRFSGGGTVVVDESTLFITFIFQKEEIALGNCPKRLLEWTETIYKPLFHPQEFWVRENDYAIKNRKVGGNAQYFTKERLLHHTTFLWDYQQQYMDLLKMPPRVPEWRKKRSHEDFVDRLKNYYPSVTSIKEKLIEVLGQHFSLSTTRQKELPEIVKRPHRRALELLHFSVFGSGNLPL